MTDSNNKQEFITVVGTSFIDFVIWDLVKESFATYRNTDFSKKRFQTPISEHGHAAAAIVLSVIGIEAYRNRIYFLEKSSVNRSVPNDLCKMLTKKSINFPTSKLQSLLEELFVVRDVIAHNHIYKVEVFSDQGWTMLGHRQKLLKGYGFDSKYKSSVSSRSKKTNLLKLNVQPAKTGFEDIFKVLVVIDLLIRIMQKVFGGGYVSFHVSHKIGGYDARNLSEILTYYFDHIPRKSFVKFLERLSTQLRNDFTSFLPPYPLSNCFISNTCPQCSKLGFDKIDNTHYCGKCGFTISIQGGVCIPEFGEKKQ